MAQFTYQDANFFRFTVLKKFANNGIIDVSNAFEGGESIMEKVTYIRHFAEKERHKANDTSVFSSKINPNDCYQDVISFSNFAKGTYNIYTMGKHVFQPNSGMTISMQRWMIFFVASGSLICGTRLIGRGDFVVLPSSCSVTIASQREQPVFYWCTTNDELHINTLLSCGYHEKEMMLGHTDNMLSVTELFENTIYRFPKNCDDSIFFRGQLTCLLSYIAPVAVSKQRVSDQLFTKCIQIIESKQGNITVDFIADHYFVSRRYLYNMFKEYKNMSPMEYILAVRMQAADKYLRSTNYSIAEIAELVGYSNYSHFSRAYTKHFSILPSERRKQLAEAMRAEEQNGNKEMMLLDE